MPKLSRSRTFLLATSVAAVTTFASGCGGDDAATEASVGVATNRTVAQDAPPAAIANGALASIADGAGSRERLAYVHPAALDALTATPGVDFNADEISRLVLGSSGAADLRTASPVPTTAVRVGNGRAGATVLDAPSGRTVEGSSRSTRETLEATTPKVSAIAAETPSAVQSCLGEPAAEVIVGPAKLGRMAAAGAAIVDTADAPAGPKLIVCLAPHYARELHAGETRLSAAFPAKGVAADRAPIIAEQEIGEREIVGATVPLEQVDPALVRELLAGGAALEQLALG